MEKLKKSKKTSLSWEKYKSIRNKVYKRKYRPKIGLLNSKYNIYKDLNKSTISKNWKSSFIKKHKWSNSKNYSILNKIKMKKFLKAPKSTRKNSFLKNNKFKKNKILIKK